MELISFVFRSSRLLVVSTVLASVASGVLGAAVIAVINHSLSSREAGGSGLLVVFVAIVLAKTLTQFASQLMLVRFAQNSLLALCRNICDKILGTPFERLERLGSARLLATLTDDVAVVSAAMQGMTAIATNGAVLVGCAAYLAWLSWKMLLACIVLVLVGVVGYRALTTRAFGAIYAARAGRDVLIKNFRTLIDGMKELKLSRAKSATFMRDELDSSAEALRKHNVDATKLHLMADSWNQLLFYTLIGTVIFLMPSLREASTEALTGYVFAALYMMTPIWTIVGTVPTFMRGQVSLERIRQLGDELKSADYAGMCKPVVGQQPVVIAFEGVNYAYPAAPTDEHGFRVGPLNVELRGGEIVFVTGGNGSGKSTFVKLLTGLYVPQSGFLRMGSETVGDENRSRYRELFGVVFADYHLFEKLYGVDVRGRDAEISELLRILQIDRHVRVEDGRFSTTALSSGQRRRLALLGAYLEDRPIYVFDEWAADQDPAYKNVFYTRLLPALRSRGKCVVVVTHDDRYFSQGDRVLHLESGQLEEVAPHGAAAYWAGRAADSVAER